VLAASHALFLHGQSSNARIMTIIRVLKDSWTPGQDSHLRGVEAIHYSYFISPYRYAVQVARNPYKIIKC
jgi:hypothetical protein